MERMKKQFTFVDEMDLLSAESSTEGKKFNYADRRDDFA